MSSTDASADVFAELATIIRRVLNRDVELSLSTEATDVAGWDSHATVEIIFEVEERYGFQFSNNEMEEVEGIPSLLRLIAIRTAPAEAAQ